MVNQKLGFITVAICFGYITTLTGLLEATHYERLAQEAHADILRTTVQIVGYSLQRV